MTKEDQARLLQPTEGEGEDHATATSTAAATRHKHWRCNFDLATLKENVPILKKNSAFVGHVWLSVSVAFYVTLMALPVYSSKINFMFFGHVDTRRRRVVR